MKASASLPSGPRRWRWGSPERRRRNDSVRTDKEKPSPPPSIGVVGYSWDVVSGAAQYDYEYQQVPVGTPIQDLETVAPLGDLMTQSWPQSEFQNQTSNYENLTGVSLPGNQVALPLPGTICDQANYAYRGRYRVWKGSNVSKFSAWWIFWDLSDSG
jgi:hypothetical protein